MKVQIKKSFAGYPEGHIIEIDEVNNNQYNDVIYWLRRCEDGKIDGYCELIEWNGKKVKKEENVVQSDIITENVRVKKVNKYKVKE